MLIFSRGRIFLSKDTNVLEEKMDCRRCWGYQNINARNLWCRRT